MPATSTPEWTAALADPREALDVELKNWLDLAGDPAAKATLAKAVLALANHGGGIVILGMTETPDGVRPAQGRPATLDRYGQDLVNGIVSNYADPPFHCAVHLRPGPDGQVYPAVVVPGGHRVPVRARRAGPNGNIVQNGAIYVRRPGPSSETPQNAQDWDALLARCLANRRDEMFDQIRALITGAVPAAAVPARPARLDGWIEDCLARWAALADALPPGDPGRCEGGRQWFAIELGGAVRNLPGARFPEALRSAEVAYGGCPPFWWPNRAGITPYPVDGVVECWLGGDDQQGYGRRGGSHSDFWRVSPEGLAFLLRGYREDDLATSSDRSLVPSGGGLELTWPVELIAEILLYAASLAARLVEGPATVTLVAGMDGLRGRSLFSLGGRRAIFGRSPARQDAVALRTTVDADAIGPNLAEIVHPLLAPLYALFDFFDLPAAMVAELVSELRNMRRR